MGAAGFRRWCQSWVRIEDKEGSAGGGEVAFRLFPGQARLVSDLVGGLWLFIVKSRQLGITWLCAAYVLWRVVFGRRLLIAIVNQEKGYAFDFIERVRFMYARLPGWSQPPILKDNESLLRFAPQGIGSSAEIRSLVGGDKAARSFTGDVMVFDEASRIRAFGESLAAVQPGLTRSTRRANDGQIIVLSTTAGPAGDFWNLWANTYGEHGELLDEEGVGPNRFVPVFLSWRERPGRDDAWYAAREKELRSISKVKVKQEHPSTVEEAWEYAEGRVYPLFTRARNVGSIEIPEEAIRCRAIDWGEAGSAYVVLWVAFLKGPPGLLVDPDCKETIREFLSYRFDDDGKPAKENDHAMDALRYLVVHHDLRGLVYIYREVYRTESLAEGWHPMREAAEIHELSGWVRAPAHDRRLYRPSRDAERYELPAVADPSMGKTIQEFSQLGIPTVGYKPRRRKLRGDRAPKPGDDKIEGIRMVATLIDGSFDMDKFHQITREERSLKALRRVQTDPMHATTGLEERQLVHLARDLLKRRRK